MERDPPHFEARDGHLFLDGHQFFLRGANWYGFEALVTMQKGTKRVAVTAAPGLAAHDGRRGQTEPGRVAMRQIVRHLRSQRINAVRIAFTHDNLVYNPLASEAFTSIHPDLAQLRYLDLISEVIRAAAEQGILVLLAAACTAQRIGHRGLWFEEAHKTPPPIFSRGVVSQSWKKLADTFCDSHWNLFAVDLQV